MNTATTRTESPRGAAFETRKAGPMRRFVDVVLVRYASVALLLALIIVFSILSPQFPPPMWGRTEEGGRAVLRNEPAMAHSTIFTVRATPHP
jgi:hypothetical protein